MWKQIVLGLSRAANVTLFEIAGTRVTVAALLTALLVLLATFWIARWLRRLTERAMERLGTKPGTRGAVAGLVYYLSLLVGIGVSLETAGIDLTGLFAAGAVFAVGLGFAMQSIAQNFVAGVILLTERAIKPGDVLEVDGHVVRVRELGIRTTVATTRNGEDLVIPNALLIQTIVKNYTFENSHYRVRVGVGVSYDSDMKRVRATLERVAEEMTEQWAVAGRSPQVFMTGFGDNAVQWEVAIWMGDPWHMPAARSALHEAIWDAFAEAGIVIAYPQLDLHLDRPALETLRALGGRAA